MPLSFLNPWFWLGALAVAAPIWLHLRRKRETNLVRFSALRFLDDEPQPRQGPMRLRDLILFTLRLLALLLVVAAFAWPYLRRGDTAPVKESRVYILDNTLSHRADDGFTRDRDRLLTEIGAAGLGIQIAVIELAATPRVVVAFGDDRETAKRRLKELQPSFQRGAYLPAFRQATALLGNSLGERKRIILLGDNQENQWSENVDTPPFLRNVEVDLPKPPAALLPNLSLSEARAQRIFLGDKSLVSFTVKLSHVGEARNAYVIVRTNGQPVLNRVVDLQNQPETILLTTQWEAPPGDWLFGEAVVEGSPDALEADNRVFFSLAPVVEGKVLLLAQSPWLRLALSPDIMRGQWATRELEPASLSAELAAGQDADVFCLESNYLQSADARKLVWRYLSNGRGVVLLVNRVTPTITGYLRELGFEAEGPVAPPRDKPEGFQFVFSNHPIFHPFLSPDYGNLMEIKISQYIRLKGPQAMPLIFSESGAALFFQSQKFQGKLFVSAFGLERDQTSWPVHQTFVPFLDLTLQAARAEDPTPANFEPGEVGLVQLPGGSKVREAVLREDRHQLGRFPILQGRAEVRMPDKPGNYTLAFDDREQVEKVFSVNPSPKESQLVYVDAPEAVKLWQLNRPVENTKAAPAMQTRVSLAGILQQRLWWWMVLGALLLLVFEMILAETRREGA
jgi:hypothetical protein